MHNLTINKRFHNNDLVFDIVDENKSVRFIFIFEVETLIFDNIKEEFVKSMTFFNMDLNESVKYKAEEFPYVDILLENLKEDAIYDLLTSEFYFYIDKLPLGVSYKIKNKRNFDCECCGTIFHEDIEIRNSKKKILTTYKFNDHFGGDFPKLLDFLSKIT